jgi:hypothetical protein
VVHLRWESVTLTESVRVELATRRSTSPARMRAASTTIRDCRRSSGPRAGDAGERDVAFGQAREQDREIASRLAAVMRLDLIPTGGPPCNMKATMPPEVPARACQLGQQHSNSAVCGLVAGGA